MPLHDIPHDHFEVAPVIVEIVDMALARIEERPVGTALPAPIEGHDGETAAAQFGDHLEILLNELATSLHDDHGARLAARGRPPAGKAQRQPSGARDRADNRLGWNWQGVGSDEFQGDGDLKGDDATILQPQPDEMIWAAADGSSEPDDGCARRDRRTIHRLQPGDLATRRIDDRQHSTPVRVRWRAPPRSHPCA